MAQDRGMDLISIGIDYIEHWYTKTLTDKIKSETLKVLDEMAMYDDVLAKDIKETMTYILKFDLVIAPKHYASLGHKEPCVLITDLKGNFNELTSTDLTLYDEKKKIWLCKKENNSIIKERIFSIDELVELTSASLN